MVTKELDQYTVDCTLLLKNVTVEDAGKYKVTARNDLGESNATISLNFDSKYNILITGSNNQFQNYESEFSCFFDQLEEVLQILFVYLLLFFVRNNPIRENSGFVVSELVVGSDDQDINATISLNFDHDKTNCSCG